MNPGYDSRPNVPAATPKSDAVRLRMFEMTCGKWSQQRCFSRVQEMHVKMEDGSSGAGCVNLGHGGSPTWLLCCTLGPTMG